MSDRRAAPGEERAADSSVVTILLMILLCLWMIRMRRSLNNGKTASMTGTSVETISVQSSPARISRDFSQKRGYLRFCSCLKRRYVSACTNSQISTPRECDSHSAAGDVGVVFSQKASVVAWFQRCFRVSHLFGLPAKNTPKRTRLAQLSPYQASISVCGRSGHRS